MHVSRGENGYYFLSPSDRYKLFMHFGISLPDKRKMGDVEWRADRVSIITKLFFRSFCSAQQTLCLLCFIHSRSTDKQTRLPSNANRLLME